MKKLTLIIATASSSWMRASDPHILIGPEAAQDEGLALIWIGASLADSLQPASVLVLPLNAGSARVVEAARRAALVTSQRELEVVRSGPRESLGADHLAQRYWDALQLDVIGPWTDALPLARQLEHGPDPHPAATSAVPDELRTRLAGLSLAMTQPDPADPDPAAPPVTKPSGLEQLPHPTKLPRGQHATVAKGRIEQQIAEAGLTATWADYVKEHADFLRAHLPHPSWRAELDLHAPLINPVTDDIDPEDT